MPDDLLDTARRLAEKADCDPMSLISRRLYLLVIALMSLLIMAPAGHGQDLTPEQTQALQQIVNLQRNLDAGKVNSPGAELRTKEVSRTRNGDVSMVGYQLYAAGFTGERFDLVTIPVAPKPDLVSMGTDLLMATDGQVLDGPNDPRTLLFANLLPGEPGRIGLTSKDGKQRAFVTVVPNPIEGRDRGCSMNVVRLLPKFEIAWVQGTGFPPNSGVGFEANSLGEVHSGKLKADASGRVNTAILPAVKDKSEGEIQVTLSAPQCKPSVKFHWGSKSQ